MIKEKNLPNGWAIKPMTEVVTWGSGGTPKATESQYYDNGDIPWLIIGDLNDGVVTESQSKITELGLKNSSAKIIPAGTLLVAMYGSIGKLGITGIACIIPKGLEVCLGQRMMLLRTGQNLNNKFLMHYLNSPFLNSVITENIGGSASPHINVGDIKKFLIPVPDINEQDQTVQIIESRLSVCESIEQTVDTALAQADAMRQSILKQAFEGGVV